MENPIVLTHTDEASHRTDEGMDVSFLNQTAAQLSTATPLHDVLDVVVEFVMTVVKCDSCMVYVLEGEELVLRASKNPHSEVVDRLKIKMGQGITGWVAQHLEPVALGECAYSDARFKLFNELPEDRFEAFLSVPVVSGGRAVGVINVQNRARHQFKEREIKLIATIGFLIGAEVERVRLESENSALLDRLATRTYLDRAKGILQRELKVNEDEAYRMMQRESQDRCKSMKEIAEAVMLSDDLRRRFR
jgi:signal transduction protein with GAF and PtsI domain